ncbi:unnamed protein product [Arabidopsis halleri]
MQKKKKKEHNQKILKCIIVIVFKLQFKVDLSRLCKKHDNCQK